ncbi:autotransporter outer membrane beta-barrel domain-containing protein [Morganella morganii subsp. morganii]|uniref:autotransporter outer membrane beta-barrel domain-containing protein n=1 Tax=Morganella morganii TaxID=582 RepID=UPI001BDA3012|nr:autotransporter outer membrane beta-barrel domain-containing protein [Morganella morganii]MBT0394269.1 autotransporter outer membrane beta-barrel domain-containing protein [Morganella morganii subsp. morganii]
MNTNNIFVLLLAMQAGMAYADKYTLPVDLTTIKLKAGDIVEVKENGYAVSGYNIPLNFQGGNINVKLDNSKYNGTAYGIKLSGKQKHDLGNGSVITLRSLSGGSGLYLENGELKSDNLEINAESLSEKGSANGIYAKGANLNLGSNSKITVNNLKKTTTSWSDSAAIFLDNSSVLNANNIELNANGSTSGILMLDGSQANLGAGSVINTGVMGVALLDDSNNKFEANGLTVNLNAVPGFDSGKNSDIRAGIYVNDGYSNKAELKNTHISNKGDGSFGVLLHGGTLTAENLSIISEGEKAYAVQTDLHSIANINGHTEIQGDIAAYQYSKINLVTNRSEQSQTVITGSIRENGRSQINWSGTDSVWNVTGNSNLGKLSLSDNSVVDFTHSTEYNNVSVKKLDGAALWNFKVNFDNNTSDTLRVSGTSKGAHQVGLVNDGSMNTNGTETKDIIFTTDGVATFTAVHDYEFGGYLYTVQRKDNDPDSTIWEVASVGKVPPGDKIPPEEDKPSEGTKTPVAKTSVNTVVGNYYLNLAEQENLQRRMSSLRNNPEGSGLWARTYHGKFDSFQSGTLDKFDMNYSGVQVGFDHILQPESADYWMLGGSLNYTDSSQDYSNGDGDQKSYSFAGYATYLSESEWYADFYGKYSYYDNKLDMRDTAGMQVNGSGNGYSLTASAELGKRIYILNQKEKTFYVEPNAQMTLSHISSNDINNSNGLKVKFDNQLSTIGRVGVNTGYNIHSTSPVTVYGKINIAHEFNGEQVYYLNNSRERLMLAGSWVEYGAGADITLDKQHLLFIEYTGSNGSKFNQNDFNLGYRYLF